MDSNMEYKIAEILDSVMQEFCCLIGDISLCEHHDVLSEDICTVCTTFEGGYHATLVLVADHALLRRLTQRAMEEEEVAPEDVEDFSKELLNVICGRVVAKLSRAAHISSRFGIPVFCIGRHMPYKEGTVCEMVFSCVSIKNEGAQLVHQLPCPPVASAG